MTLQKENRTEPRTLRQWIHCAAVVALLLCSVQADPVPVRHVQGYIHGFLVVKDMDDKIVASGDLTQLPAGGRVTVAFTLHFTDGSLYEETAVFSQNRVYRLLTYKQVMKGPAFKTPETLSLDAANGNVTVQYTDKDGTQKTVTDKLPLTPDLANGLFPLLLTEADSKAETTLSMVVSTPKPRVVKLKISASGEDAFSIGGVPAKATHYVVKIDIGGVTGVAAKVTGKQPPPTQMWIEAGNAPVFLRSEGPLYDDGPIWRIELASPAWPKH